MFFKRYLKLIMTIFLFTSFIISETYAQASAYPLQMKYPNTMIYKANTDQKVIALTFDDGPDHRFTPSILNVLAKYNVKATFFLLGTRVEKYPDVTQRIYEEGHVIGNHTFWHPQLTKTGVKNMEWEMEKNQKQIKSIIDYNTYLFRAPYGAINSEMVKLLQKKNYRGVGWSVDSEDWKSLPADKVKQNILSEVHPGAIILMHSAGHWTQDLSGTVKALDQIIPYLRKKGYRFVTIPELWTIEQSNL